MSEIPTFCQTCGEPVETVTSEEGTSHYESVAAKRIGELAVKLTREQTDALEEAAAVLDALWDFDVERGWRDSRDGTEYERMSPAPVLREILRADEVEA